MKALMALASMFIATGVFAQSPPWVPTNNVPEPASIGLLLVGVGGLGIMAARRKNQSK